MHREIERAARLQSQLRQAQEAQAAAEQRAERLAAGPGAGVAAGGEGGQRAQQQLQLRVCPTAPLHHWPCRAAAHSWFSGTQACDSLKWQRSQCGTTCPLYVALAKRNHTTCWFWLSRWQSWRWSSGRRQQRRQSQRGMPGGSLPQSGSVARLRRGPTGGLPHGRILVAASIKHLTSCRSKLSIYTSATGGPCGVVQGVCQLVGLSCPATCKELAGL